MKTLWHSTRRLSLLTPLLALVICPLLANLGAQSPTFARTDYLSLGYNHIAADFNADGKPDLAGLGTTSAAILLGNGDGTFQARVEYPVAGSGQDLAAGNFDLDGDLDLVVTINDPQISLSLLTGNGNGTFNPPVNFLNTSGLDSPTVVATDLDNDGRQDLVIGHEVACWTAPCLVGRTITVMRGNGDGTFQPAREIDIGTWAAKIAVGDLNRDGIKDLAIASHSSQVCILLGRGDGTFVQLPTMTLTDDTLGVDASDIDVADLNRDTIQDLVVAIATNGSRTAILIGNGNGTFRQPPAIITDPNLSVPQYQAIADYNGDALLDLALAVANGTWGLMQIRNGNGDGTFRAPVMYLVPPPKSSIGGGPIIAAELNGDGKPDLAVAIVGASPGLAVLRNSTGQAPPPTPAAPTLLSPANDASPSQPVTFDWTDVNAATSYRIQVDDSNTFSAPLVIDRIITASQFATGSLAARRHWWRVRGINSAGAAGPWSAVRRFTPQGATATLSAIALSPSAVVGGNTSQGTATLTAAAPSGGAVVALMSSNTAVANLPPSVTMAAGTRSASFTVETTSVSASTSVTISGSYGGATRSAILTVAPPAQTATLTVTATGRAGERVTSSPGGINVPVGSSGSASFAVGTAITLSVSNGRDAIWSGTCSSGGNKTRTCSFTLNGSAGVSANVQ